MNDQEKNRIIQQYYFNAENPAAYASARKLFHVLDKKKHPGIFTIGKIGISEHLP
jgi:hypothetical protein